MSADRPYTIEAAGHTWYHIDRPGPGCWHRGDEGGRCLSLQGVLDEHKTWAWLQAREHERLRNRVARTFWRVWISRYWRRSR